MRQKHGSTRLPVFDAANALLLAYQFVGQRTGVVELAHAFNHAGRMDRDRAVFLSIVDKIASQRLDITVKDQAHQLTFAGYVTGEPGSPPLSPVETKSSGVVRPSLLRPACRFLGGEVERPAYR